jgi:hypothetical protein
MQVRSSMKLSERLVNLIGHEIIVTTRLAGGSEEADDRDVPAGDLQEVGEDYLLVKTESEEKGGFAKEGAEWFINLSTVIHIIHQSDCKKCAIQYVEKRQKG